ncbi:serine hydrolase [Paenibacillus qinlingensis]|uniref:CubicO group peptidase (Beta-lactamase class C family) n=1 Tax=Paenibacillus qinlingensis TaxID=1837343 RepID=A0ABU1P1T9_9BACL|nr:serine hydrolase [Paenibacillus qinlingensis]MDR6553504.1 CubicO group peptidase (beta-lactamase class C family) [Paenibacillus qinlingensis]
MLTNVTSPPQSGYGTVSHPADLWPTQGWPTSTPEAQGIFSATLAKTFEVFDKQGVHSVAIIRHGVLVADAYKEGIQAEIPQDMKSVTKSVTSALVGIALAEGKLKSPEQRLAVFFPELEKDPLKSKIRLKHLLSMTSGLAWDNYQEHSSNEMMHEPDWIQYILDRPVKHEPGEVFNYSNGDAHLLSAVLEKVTGMTMLDYAKSRLFEPLGITNVSWNHDHNGMTIGAWALALTLEDMAKIGLLYLKEGQWEGKSIIPQAWIRTSLAKRIHLNYSNGTRGTYGYYWWSKTLAKGIVRGSRKEMDVFYASGSGGRRIFVIPDLDLIVALTANTEDVDMPEGLLLHVLQSIRSDKGLTENPVANAQLKQAIQAFSTSAVI